MNEEEKKAIERIEDTFYSDLGKGINKFQKITLYEDSIKDVRIVLNLLEKLQKENEELKETYKSEKKMKNEYVKLYQDLLLKENVIPIQKVIEYLDNQQKQWIEDRELKESDSEIIFARNFLQELIKEEEEKHKENV